MERAAELQSLARRMMAEGGAIGGYGLELRALIGEQPCTCDTPNCGCSDPSVAVCRTCGGRVSLRAGVKS